MAQIDRFVPFILRWAAGVTRKPEESVKQLFVRARRSGWSDDPLDAGGATQCDVTLATYCAYCRKKRLPIPDKSRLRVIPYEHWIDILKSMYWDRWHADEIQSQRVAEILVDWVWASGSYGVTRPQKLLGVTADGIVGPKTIAAVNASDTDSLLAKIKHDRVKFCNEIVARHPSQKKWLSGWLNRINALVLSATVLLVLSACQPCRQVVVPTVERTDSVTNADMSYTSRVRVDSIHVTDSIVTVVRGDTVTTDRWHTAYRDRLRVDTVERLALKTIFRTRTVTLRVSGHQPETKWQRVVSAIGVLALALAFCVSVLLLWHKNQILKRI